METYKNLLKEAGIKPTFQRIKILEYLDKNHVHPTVDMIYVALFKKVPTLSKTTVYNTLDALHQKGLVNVLTLTGSELRYEYKHKSHHHFFCISCGNILDVDVGCIYQDTQQIEGHKIDEIHGYFKGICTDCMTKDKKQ